MSTPSRRAVLQLVGAAFGAAALGGCGHEDGRTTLTFFQFKPEAKQHFQGLAREFEALNPDLRIVVDTVPDPETALRTRLVKDDMPDVLTLNANGTFGEFASAGVFADFAEEPVLDGVKPAYVDVIRELGAGSSGAVNGVPFAANTSGVLYNEELFARHGVAVPETWDALLAAARAFEDAGVTPFYGMLADAWTAQAALSPLVSQTIPEDFFRRRFAGEATFEEGFREAAGKLAALFEHTQPDPVATGYEDGTAAFARGESAMLLLGSYAVPQIRSFKPAFEVGSFALPATNDPQATTVVSGVDVVITAGAQGRHPEEVRRFIDFLMQPATVRAYADAQVAVPALEGISNDDPALAGMQPYLDQERIVGFFDHQFIPAIPLGALLQQFLIDRGTLKFTRALDDAWDKIARRRTWGLGAVES
ncbi:ABC transporter substrate-binding protein [Sinomonas mesophila]|uniref:ABC transporter substrate-binding protein n=1 Tax=Sinomonas mesophila TaxID=1531955 RepID=UPI0009856168|nr:extracellular solute-binding protein [Sinomonas mesophila]